MITGRGLGLLAGAVALWLVGRLLGIAELNVLAVAAVALVAAGALAIRLSSASVGVTRSLSSSRILPGQRADAVVSLRNDTRLPVSLLLAEDACHYALASRPRFVVPGLPPGAAVTLRYPLTGSLRGRYTVGPLTLRVRDPFGLTERVRRDNQVSQVVVYPHVEALDEGVARGTHQGSGSSEVRRVFNVGDEFYTLREYVTGDDLRQVHWPSSARQGMLMVRQQEQPWQAHATIVCDLRALVHHGYGDESSAEKAVSAAASLVWHLADRGYQLRLCTETDSLAPEVARWDVLLERLAEVRTSRVRSLAPVLGRLRGAGAEGLLAAVVAPSLSDVPVERDPETRALLQAGRGFSGRLALVIDSRTSAQSAARAERLALVLTGAGWRATTVAAGEPLAERWRLLVGRSSAARARAAAAAVSGSST